MKRFPAPRVTSSDTMGRGVDYALTIALLCGIGFALDRWLGTTPWLTVTFAVLGGVGVFAALKYRYDDQMAEHEARRREQANAGRPSS